MLRAGWFAASNRMGDSGWSSSASNAPKGTSFTKRMTGLRSAGFCSSPLRSNRGKDALIPRFGYSCAAWDPPSWSGDPERVGLAELTSTVDFVNRLGLQEFAALGALRF